MSDNENKKLFEKCKQEANLKPVDDPRLNKRSHNTAVPKHLLIKAAEMAAYYDILKDLDEKFKMAKKELFLGMKSSNITSLELPDQRQIKLVTSKSKSLNKTNLKKILKEKAVEKIWDLLPTKESESLRIPKKEVEPNDDLI